MYARKRKFPLNILIILVLLGVLIGSAVAKYIYSEELTATVTFSASLAESLLVEEHEAVRQADGAYTLGSTVLPLRDTDGKVIEGEGGKKGNAYILLPGLDIPKDPYVKVVNKTPLDAYLYIEVVDTTNSAIEYQIDTDNWTDLGIEGRMVFVYKNGLKINNTNCPNGEIYILKDNEVTVSQTLLAETEAEKKDDKLSFNAYLYEARNANYKDIFLNPNPST